MAETIDRTAALIALRPGPTQALETALAAMDLTLPPMGRFSEAGGLTLASMSPHQLLALRDGPDAPLMDELAPLSQEAGIIDLSDSRVSVRIAGPGTANRLARLVPLDLHSSRFAPGCCAQTLVAHLSVLVMQTGSETYELHCGRSFAGSFLRAVALVDS